MRHLSKFLMLILPLVLATQILAQDSTNQQMRIVPEVKACRVNPHPPIIDGNLNDEVWNNPEIDIIRDFTQRTPDEGEAPSESTLVAIVYDDEAIYFAVWSYDSEPDKIMKQLVRRDRYAEADRIAIRIDPFHDHLTGYQFDINASGVVRDLRLYNDNHMDDSWNAVWEADVKIQPWGWSSEFRIPYSCLRFAEKEVHTWGVDIARYLPRKEESMRWAFVPEEEGGFVRNFGHLTGLTGLKPARHLEVLPYSVAQLETEEASIANTNGRDIFGNTGVDIKYGLSSNLTLDATINPDFGQVELDQPVLNLSIYESWFPERRPFFLEGSNLFDTEFSVFYSRRIGRNPQSGIDDGEYAYAISTPKATTILAAGKLTGKLASGTSIALLTAFTQEEKAQYAAQTNVVLDSNLVAGEDRYDVFTASADTVQREAIVEPRANYSVLRIKQDILGNSSIGGILTIASQETYHPAVVGGVDWRIHTGLGSWLTRGQVLLSRNDAENTGYGIDLTIEKECGKHIRGSFGGTVKSPEFDINRLGYSGRSNTKSVYGWMQYRTSDDWWIIRNSWNNINFYSGWNFDGINRNLGANYNFYLDFINSWSLGGGFSIQAEKYSDDETRGNGLWEWPETPTYAWWSSLNTDRRKSISFNWNPGGGQDRGGSWFANYIGVELRPATNIEFDLGVNYSGNRSVTRWVGNIEDSSLFADMDRDQVTFHIGSTVLLNRNLSFQLSAQGLISGIDYQNYRYYQGDNNYGGQVDGFNTDYNYSALNSTMLIRWEYMPGSTVYLVWTRSRSEFDDTVNDLDIGRDFDRFFSRGSENLFLIKASYWLNM